MPEANRIIALSITFVIAVTMISAMLPAINDNTGTVTVTNESVTADPGTWQDLQGFEIVSSSETVVNSTGTTLSSPDDYALDEAEGRIQFNTSSSSVSSGEDINVSYDYEASSGTSETVVDLWPLFVALVLIATAGAYIQREL